MDHVGAIQNQFAQMSKVFSISDTRTVNELILFLKVLYYNTQGRIYYMAECQGPHAWIVRPFFGLPSTFRRKIQRISGKDFFRLYLQYICTKSARGSARCKSLPDRIGVMVVPQVHRQGSFLLICFCHKTF